MDMITALVTGERTARIAIASFVAPDDPVTGRLLGDVGAVETVRLLTTDGPVPSMDTVAAALWRKRLSWLLGSAVGVSGTRRWGCGR